MGTITATFGLDAKLELSRRLFGVTSLAVGFAAAVRPVAAATIHTDDTGLAVGEAAVPVGDGQVPAYFAMPESGGPFPTILVVQEIFGVHEHIKDVCRRFAKQGYFAVATELFTRQGDVSQLTDIDTIIHRVVSKVPDDQVMADLDSTVAWARSTGSADTGRLAITGFCWGGRITWLYAEHSPQVKAAVAWYGRVQGSTTDLQPRQPSDLVAQLQAPLLGLYGVKDTGIPIAGVREVEASARRAGKTVEIVAFEDAGHAFFADYRPSYVPAAAEEAWRHCLAWLAKYDVA